VHHTFGNQKFLVHWAGSPLRAAAAGTKVPVTISLAVHPADWDADAYITSHPPQPTPTGQHAVPTPAAAAGSSGGQVGGNSQAPGSAGASEVTFSATAVKDPNGSVRLAGWYAAAGTGIVKGLPNDYTQGEHDIVLQEQVRLWQRYCLAGRHGTMQMLLQMKQSFAYTVNSSDRPRDQG
jgi:hypothetical protein